MPAALPTQTFALVATRHNSAQAQTPASLQAPPRLHPNLDPGRTVPLELACAHPHAPPHLILQLAALGRERPGCEQDSSLMAPGHARQLINGLRAQRFVAELQSSQELAPTAGHLQWRQIPGTCRCGQAGNAPTQEEQRGCCCAPICFSSCRSTLHLTGWRSHKGKSLWVLWAGSRLLLAQPSQSHCCPPSDSDHAHQLLEHSSLNLHQQLPGRPRNT